MANDLRIIDKRKYEYECTDNCFTGNILPKV